MRHRAPETTRPDLDEDGAGGPLRIGGAYPPRLTPTRYDRSRAHAPRAARTWAGTSALLAVAGAASIVVGLQDGARPTRLDVPVAVVAAPFPAPTPAMNRITLPRTTEAPPVLQLPASDPVQVRIPALGITSRVMHLGLQRDGSMEVPPAAYPVGWYDHSPTPGQLGPAVLAGHVDWNGNPGAFYGLAELLPGDEVVVDRADGTVATFRVDRVEEHAKDEFPADAVYDDIDSAGLRLITCGGSFDEDAGDYRDNVIVFASLVTTS
ncbi:Sortase family protein [Modestobacter sp. DSM 44400]|uniref:class F sortase n=1 Tax=Modestobacter sp. DSM 44400 TaxID=1550230 RepID=UPI0008987159|nr:class F sortase [Modestobacter sp. DSM 44400]SDX74636.1 Sortase family protein [Modestobacter sp. DSM 44400]